MSYIWMDMRQVGMPEMGRLLGSSVLCQWREMIPAAYDAADLLFRAGFVTK
jgi:hypothetical protein